MATEEVGYILDNADARLLLGDQEFAATADVLPHLHLLDAAAQSNSTRLASPAQTPAGRRVTHPDDLFRLMYTSGNTDRPQGVTHSHSNFYWKSADHVLALGLSAANRLLVAGPLYHVGAFDLPGMAVPKRLVRSVARWHISKSRCAGPQGQHLAAGTTGCLRGPKISRG